MSDRQKLYSIADCLIVLNRRGAYKFETDKQNYLRTVMVGQTDTLLVRQANRGWYAIET